MLTCLVLGACHTLQRCCACLPERSSPRLSCSCPAYVATACASASFSSFSRRLISLLYVQGDGGGRLIPPLRGG